MANKEVPQSIEELEAMMADLEAQLNAEQESVTAAPEVDPGPQAEPEAADHSEVEQAQPEEVPLPEPDSEPEPTAMSEPAPEPAPARPQSRPAPEPEPPVTPPGQLNYWVDVHQFRRDISLDSTNMDKAMMEQAGLRAFYGAQAANAEAQASREKAKFEILEARLYELIRKQLASEGEKVTEKMIEAAVKKDPRWLAGKNRVIEAEAIAGINKSLAISLADRRDMLIQLGSDRREEFKGQLRIVANEQEKQDLAERARAAAGKAVSKHAFPV